MKCYIQKLISMLNNYKKMFYYCPYINIVMESTKIVREASTAYVYIYVRFLHGALQLLMPDL